MKENIYKDKLISFIDCTSIFPFNLLSKNFTDMISFKDDNFRKWMNYDMKYCWRKILLI
jgi:hypothetical protein